MMKRGFSVQAAAEVTEDVSYDREFTASRVKGLATEAGIIQRDFASYLGICPLTMNKRLNGHLDFTPRELVEIAGIFIVSTDWLLGLE